MAVYDFKIPVVFLSLFLFHCAYGATQGEVDYLGTNMDVKIKTVDNLINELAHFQCQITLTNIGSEVIRGGDWAIYFCFVRHIERPEEGEPTDNDYIQYGVNITHVSGCLHRLEPINTFRDISPNGVTVINFLGVNWQSSKTDYMPNWYVVSTSSDVSPRTLISTSGESLDFVGSFDEPRQWKRYDFTDSEGNVISDKYDPFSPRVRFVLNDVQDLGSAPKLLLPTPAFIESNPRKTVYFGTNDWAIVVQDQDNVLQSAARFLSALTGMPILNEVLDFRYIRFHVGSPEVMVDGKRSNSSEAYELRTDATGQWASITAETAAGAFYGLQSLRALWNDNMETPEVNIRDAPRYEYRGMHLDVGRNFHKKDYVIKLLDVMARYKLNTFYFHITDDEGWRLEIPGLEELTQVGSKRCFDLKEESCVVSQLGSGPTTQSSGSGYFTVGEYQDILRYAFDRHIEVIPEFDMPGHGHAAIAAMKKRHDALLAQGDREGALEYLLIDLNDTSDYESIQMFKDNAINPCMDSTYNFVNHIVREVVKMHQNISPLKTFNFGGDEVAKGAWENSTECEHLMERLRNLRDAKDLKEYFVRQVANISSAYGLNLAAWEDGLMGRDNSPYDIAKLPNKNVYGYCWDNVWEWGAANRPYKLANSNFKVIMAQATHLYFDHPYEPDPEERGFYWAPRYTDTRKTFGFMPDNIYANADVTRSGDPYTEDQLCEEIKGESQCIPLEKPENVIGMQGHLWSETIRTPGQADYMIFPRLLALAERAWHKGDWEDIKDWNERKKMRNADWDKFANTLGYRELKRLDDMGIKYRVPQPGASVVNGRLSTNVVFPGLTVEYSTDDGKTWCSETDVSIQGKTLFRTRSADGGRTSRIETVMFPEVSGSSILIPNVLLFLTIALMTITSKFN